MAAEEHANISWLKEILHAIDVTVDQVLVPRSNTDERPELDYRAVSSQVSEIPVPGFIHQRRSAQRQAPPSNQSDDETWKTALNAALSGSSSETILVHLIVEANRTVTSELEGYTLRSELAIMAETVKALRHDQRLVALVPNSFNVQLSAGPLREWLSRRHRIEWIIYLGADAARALNVHSQFRFALLIVRIGQSANETHHPLRMVDLSTRPRTDWPRILANCKQRGGGEVDSSIVQRDQPLDDLPWVYERFTDEFQDTRQDAAQLGELCPLESFIHDIRRGVHRHLKAEQLHEIGKFDEIPENMIPCFSGRSIESDGSLGDPLYVIERGELESEHLIEPGDVLVRSVVSPGRHAKFVLAAQVTEEDLPATFDHTCIRLRWRKGLSSHAIDLLSRYLNSSHARDWLIAHGMQFHMTMELLKQLEVPDPSDDVLNALEQLADAEQQYRAWADEVAATRASIFATTSLQDQVSELLQKQRVEQERLQAARNAETYEHQIRHYFPYPIAFRREALRQERPGKPTIDAVLECAEHLLTLLAILALLQEEQAGAESQRVTKTLKAFVQGSSLKLDWGKCVALLEQGTLLTHKHPNPLVLPFPDLGELADVIRNDSSTWAVAEGQLREWRNKQSHLQRLPETQLEEMSRDFVDYLDMMLQSVSFLSTLPLIQVEDYELDSLTGQRTAVFQMIQGISSAFQRETHTVNSELPRHALGFLTRSGEFLLASPWLVMETCPVCKRPEVFVFNRYEQGESTYIAMETGHPHENPAMTSAIASVIENSR